jgi:hypothetical protein
MDEGVSPTPTREEWMKAFLSEWKSRLAELTPEELALLHADTTGERADALLVSVKQSLPPMPEK